jgi:PKD repeat protein
MQPIRTLLSIIICSGLLLPSCKKDTVEGGPDVNFSTSVDAYTVTFTNKTTGGTSYKWDFGDGTVSAEENPTHTYPGKGKYVPTLYVTTSGGKTGEGSTVIRIAKSSAIKLNDNSLADWDTVTYNVKVSGTGGGIFRKAKLDYDAENVYFYFEMASAVANGDIFDFYLDADNNSTTGLTTWVASGSGNDVLMEGAMLANWFDLFYHTGGQTSFTFDMQTITDFYQIGTVKEAGGIVKFEGKLVRSKIKYLTGKGMKLAVTATKSDWSATLGIIPDPGTAAFYLNMTD